MAGPFLDLQRFGTTDTRVRRQERIEKLVGFVLLAPPIKRITLVDVNTAVEIGENPCSAEYMTGGER